MKHYPRLIQDESGIALVTGLILLMGLTVIGIFAINTAIVHQDISANLKATKQGFYLAEAGIQHASRFLANNINQWGTYAYTTAQPLALTPPASLSDIGTYTVTIQNAGGVSRRVQSTGTSSGKSQAVIEALFGHNPSYPCAFCSQGNITVRGGGITDSFDSGVAPYNPATAGHNGSVVANGDVTISGDNTQVRGNAAAGGTVSAGTGQVTGTITNGAARQYFPPVAPCGPPYSSGSGITGGTYDSTSGDLRGTSHDAITIAAGTYCFHSVDLAGNSTLTVTGKVQLYVIADSNFTGDGIINAADINPKAGDFQIFSSLSSPNHGIMISGGSAAYATIYAPNAYVKFAGNSDFYGSVVGGGDDDTGGAKIHYDEALKRLPNAGLVLVSWRQVF